MRDRRWYVEGGGSCDDCDDCDGNGVRSVSGGGYGADLDELDGWYVGVVLRDCLCGTVRSGSNEIWYAFDLGICGSLGGGVGVGCNCCGCSSNCSR